MLFRSGGIIGPLLFGHMIATNDRTWVMVAFLIGAGVMAVGGIAEIFLGVKAEQAPLEDIAKPLTAEEAETGKLPGDEDGAADEPTGRERRWQERGERRSSYERAGRRRYRPGPGMGEAFYSPGMLGTAVHSRPVSQAILDREIDAIAAIVDRDGPLQREDIARRIGAQQWGPGRFRNALFEAEAEGRIRRISRTLYGPIERT